MYAYVHAHIYGIGVLLTGPVLDGKNQVSPTYAISKWKKNC